MTAGEPAADEPLALDEVIELALQQNPALQAEIERRREVVAGIREARAAAWPQLDLVAGWSRSRNPALLNSPDFDEIIRQFPDFEPGEQELWDLAIEIQQILYSSGKVKAGIELAGLVVDITEARIEALRLDTALTAAVDAYRLLAAERALETVEVQQKARRESLAVVEVRYELGVATRLELLRGEAALAQVAPTLERLRGRREVAKSRLRVVMGLDPGTPVEIVADPGSPAAPPAFDRLMEIATARRPELQDLRLQFDALERQRTVTLAYARPQLELNGRYGREARLPENLDETLFDHWRLAIQLNWSLFDGGRRRAQAAQLDSQRDRLRWLLADLESRIAFEIEEALAEYRTARERWRSAEVSTRAAREATFVAGESYELGVVLQADLLDAQDQQIQAELVSIEAFFDSLMESAGLRRAVGVLPTDPLSMEPEEALATSSSSVGSPLVCCVRSFVGKSAPGFRGFRSRSWPS